MLCRRLRDAAQKAAKIGHATIRLLMPFGMVVQCDFHPLDTLQHLHAFVTHVVIKPAFANNITLFVTPPKKVLKGVDLQASFWDMGMVPGAYVHVSIDSDISENGLEVSLASEPASQEHMCKHFLRSEVLAAEVESCPRAITICSQCDGRQQGRGRATADTCDFRSTKVAASGTTVPKWLKLGK
jgi:hypothetical protein